MGDVTDERLEHSIHGLSGRQLAVALFGKYLVLTVYGIWAAVVELPTFVLVGSSTFATAWASAVADKWDAAPTALIPIAVCILPTIRWISLIRRPKGGAVQL